MEMQNYSLLFFFLSLTQTHQHVLLRVLQLLGIEEMNRCTVVKCFVLFCFTELLHIPPGSKDAAVFSPGGDKGSAAAPGEP